MFIYCTEKFSKTGIKSVCEMEIGRDESVSTTFCFLN